MTCEGCVATVQRKLANVAGVTSVRVNLPSNDATITMDRHVSTSDLNKALGGSKYSVVDIAPELIHANDSSIQKQKSKLKTYLPIFLIFGYIVAITVLIEVTNPPFAVDRWMRHFMGGFFMCFSFFKLLDIPAFAMSYSSYDIIAKRWLGYGYVYPFIELTLGLLFLIPAAHIVGNIATLVVMGISIIGVLQSVLNKRTIQCACLGAVFNLPMSTVTVIEDALMIAMAAMSIML